MAFDWCGIDCDHPIADRVTEIKGVWVITTCAKCNAEIKREKS